MRSTDRILTTHVGSLVRPPELIHFLMKEQVGEPFDEAAFEACLADTVKEVVKQQANAGVDLVSDGEFGKTVSWSRYVMDRLDGFEERKGTVGVMRAVTGQDRKRFADFYKEYEEQHGVVGMGTEARAFGRWAITGPVKYKGFDAVKRDIDHLKAGVAAASGVTGFLPVVAPASVVPDREDEYYKTKEEALIAIAEALREEYRAILDAGLMLQIDDAFLPALYDVMVPPMTLEEYRKWAGQQIEALNHALEGLPTDRIRYHLCWGSWNGPHTNDVALEAIIDLILQVKADGLSLEQANPRHEHEWQVWRDVKLPDDKVLLPGVVTHSTNIVEHPRLVAERIERLANLVGRERVVASTDCGFAQGPFTKRVHESVMWAKLECLAEGARLASKVLW